MLQLEDKLRGGGEALAAAGFTWLGHLAIVDVAWCISGANEAAPVSWLGSMSTRRNSSRGRSEYTRKVASRPVPSL